MSFVKVIPPGQADAHMQQQYEQGERNNQVPNLAIAQAARVEDIIP